MTRDETNPLAIHIGQRLRHRRLIGGLSQQKLADAVDIGIKQIARYERGTAIPSVATLLRLARYFETAVDYFLVGFGGEL